MYLHNYNEIQSDPILYIKSIFCRICRLYSSKNLFSNVRSITIDLVTATCRRYFYKIRLNSFLLTMFRNVRSMVLDSVNSKNLNRKLSVSGNLLLEEKYYLSILPTSLNERRE